MYSGETRRKIIVIGVLAVLFIGYVLFDKSGIIKSIGLPTGNEWYFRLFDCILPLSLFCIAAWKRNAPVATGTGIILASSIIEFLARIEIFGIWGYTVSIAILFAGCLALAWHSASHGLGSKWHRLLGVIPAIFGIAALAWFPLDGVYSVLVAVLTATTGLGVAMLYFAGKGDVLGIAAFLIMSFRYASLATPWISWLAPVLNATGFFLVGYFIASKSSGGVDKV